MKKDGLMRLTFPDKSQTQPFPYRNGKFHGTFSIYLSDNLMDASQNGMSMDCIIANWLNEHKDALPASLFPKPKKGQTEKFAFAYVVKSSVWFITSILPGGREPAFAVRLMHNLGKFTDFFDSLSKSQFKKEHGGKTICLRLRTPLEPKERDRSRPRDPNNTGSHAKATPMTKGALRRAEKAGLHYAPLPKKKVYPITELAKRALAELG